MSKEKSVTRLVQDLVAKKCGVLSNDDSLDYMILHQYLQLYKQPLSEDSQAIIKLAEVAVDKHNKKGKSKKNKKEKLKKKNKKLLAEDPPPGKKKAKLSKVTPAGVKV
jgi:hypothetical protein